MATVTGSEAIYRRQIVHLVKALCEVPADLRWKWRGEIWAKSPEVWTFDEALVLLVLNNLPLAEKAAGRAAARVPTELRKLPAEGWRTHLTLIK